MHTARVTIACLIILFSLSMGAFADTPCESTSPSYETLRNLEMMGCFNTEALNSLLRQVNELLPEHFDRSIPDANTQRAHQFDSALALLLENLQTEQGTGNDFSLIKPFEVLSRKIDNATTQGPGVKQDWIFDGQEGMVGNTGIDIKSYINTHCATTAEACQAAFDNTLTLLRTSESMAIVALRTDPITWAVFQSEYAVINDQWNNYLFKARSQFLWELNLNSALFDRQRDKSEAFPSPPEHQWILLHPEVALEYVGGADKGSRFEPSIVMEWVGYNRWRWSGSKMRNPLGLSIISTFSDRAGADAVGYGIQVHYKNNYSLGITTRSGDTGIFISVDLGKYLMDQKSRLQSAREKFNLRSSVLD
jgi:ABC-type transporter Mla MlaB component